MITNKNMHGRCGEGISMAKKSLERVNRRGMRVLVLPLVLAAALTVSGCGGMFGKIGGGSGTGTENGSQDTTSGEKAKAKEQTGANGNAAGAGVTAADPTAESNTGATAAADAKAGADTADTKAAAKSEADAAGADTKKKTDTKAAAGTTGAETAAEDATGAAAAKAKTGKDAPLIEKTDGGTQTQSAGGKEEDKYAGYSEFTSSGMGFSFRYDPVNKAKATDAGACEMTIGEEKDLIGLYVSSVLAEGMAAPAQILEEEAGDVNQKYKSSLVEKPVRTNLAVDDHELTGQTWAYSMPSGGTVECSSFIEVRGGHYIFFRTEAMRDDLAPANDALKLAIRTLKLTTGKKSTKAAAKAGDSSTAAAAESSTSKGAEKAEEDTSKTVGIADLTGGGTDEKEGKTEAFGGQYSFDVDEKWLVESDETATTVYTRGSMQGAYFVVDKIEMEEKPANYLSNRAEEIQKNLGERLIMKPEVRTVELGERKLTGIEYEYASADGARNYYQAEYIETTALGTFIWELSCNQGDNESVAAMLSAMETFMPN